MMALMVSYNPQLLATDGLLSTFLTSEADVFVLEDADARLTARTQGNTLMHRLLSVSDGLVTLAGKKLIFSTNLNSPAEIDAALLRPGRCFDVPAFRRLTSEADVFVLEDADARLTARTQGNTLMHRLLSVSDGLVTLAGKKLIFSTNLNSPAEIDAALLRPGRCFDVPAFRRLTFSEACALTQAAGVSPPADAQRSYSAAEVFHTGGNGVPSRPRRPVGFV